MPDPISIMAITTAVSSLYSFAEGGRQSRKKRRAARNAQRQARQEAIANQNQLAEDAYQKRRAAQGFYGAVSVDPNKPMSETSASGQEIASIAAQGMDDKQTDINNSVVLG